MPRGIRQQKHHRGHRRPARTPQRNGRRRELAGYHLATLLSLHEWFAEHDLPVPRLLILDQPSPVYFPSDYENAGPEPEREADRTSLRRAFFEVITEVITNLAPGLQVIVMEHADLQAPVFSTAVVERWRRGQGALVPREWIDGGTAAVDPTPDDGDAFSDGRLF